MKAKKLLCLLAAVGMLFAFVISTGADFGDYGGDADYGGFDSYDSYDSYDDYDSYDNYDYDTYDSDTDNNYNNYDNGYYIGNTSSFDNNSRGGGLGAGILIAIIIIVVVLILKRKKGSTPTPVVGGGAMPTDTSTLKPVEEYKTLDEGFVPAEFQEKLSNMYVQFQNAWQNKDLEELRPYLTDAFYTQCDRQLENYRTNHQTNRVERISVLGVTLVGWKQESGNDVMVARLKTRIVDYVVDDETGNIVRGSNTAEKFMEYEWDLVRTSGQVTGHADGTTAQICPSCGAHVDINHSAKCEYCGTILTSDTFDWAVSTIKGLSQRTSS